MQPGLARVAATRDGIGGIVGRRREYFSWRFVIDFAGGDLPLIGKHVKVEPVINASRGRIELAMAQPLKSTGGYRAMFDLRPLDDAKALKRIRRGLASGRQIHSPLPLQIASPSESWICGRQSAFGRRSLSPW